MSKIPDQVAAVLSTYGLTALEFEHGSTPTAETAAARIRVSVGQIAKSLLFTDNNGYFALFVCAGDRKLSTSRMKQLTGKKLSMADRETTLRITGFSPGGVCPFGVPPGLNIFLDSSLKEWETIYPAAGTDSSGVPLNYQRLLEITGALECSVVKDHEK